MSPTDPRDYPYVTKLDVLFDPLQKIDVQAIADSVRDKWFNQTLCKVNDSVVRMGVVEGEYHWHKHDDLDEFFYVVDGEFLIDLEGSTVNLLPKQAFVVPKGVVHRTRAPQRCVIIMVEGESIVPTGD
jgi:mannose-6-phosphate isomerase-like protein (cupin superfamily)